MIEAKDLPESHRGATIEYTVNAADMVTLEAWITMADGVELFVTERLMRVITEDKDDIRRTLMAQVIARIDHQLDAEHDSWPMEVAATRRRSP